MFGCNIAQKKGRNYYPYKNVGEGDLISHALGGDGKQVTFKLVYRRGLHKVFLLAEISTFIQNNIKQLILFIGYRIISFYLLGYQDKFPCSSKPCVTASTV